MSPWVLNLQGKKINYLVIFSFFLSSFFYLSAFFALFAPLPLIWFGMTYGRYWAWLSAFVNTLIVLAFSQDLSIVYYIFFVVILALSLLEFLIKQYSLEKTVILTSLTVLCSLVVATLLYKYCFYGDPLQNLKSQISDFVEVLSKHSTTGWMQVKDLSQDEVVLYWKNRILKEFPSALCIFILVLVCSNLILLLKLNPLAVREKLGLSLDFYRYWKAPDFLIWPTIISGALLVFPLGLLSEVGINIFKVLMTIYLIQGISIISYFLNYFKLKIFTQWLLWFFILLFMVPFILSVGFFDFWMDVRSRVRSM